MTAAMRLNFGRFAGELVTEIPTPYLIWVSGLADLRPALRRAIDAELEARGRVEFARRYGDGRDVVRFAPEDRPLIGEVIRLGLRAAARQYHPDLNGGDGGEMMRRVNRLAEQLRGQLEGGAC